MPSKFDELRRGNVVEVEPGVTGKLNNEKRSLELSTGQVLDVGDNPNFFPKNQQDIARSKQREYVEKSAKGPAGEFLHQYATQGVAGGARDMLSYLSQSGEEYANNKYAESATSQRISKESPYISGAATAANIGTDLALTRGMSALKAAPLLSTASAGSRILTEPANVAGEAAISAAFGKLIDKGGEWAKTASQRRAASRALPAEQEAVRNANILGEQNVKEINAARKHEFNVLETDVKNYNQMIKQREQDALLARKNEMVEAQNRYKQAISSQNATKQEIKILNDEFKAKQSAYKKSLNEQPSLQRKAQEEYSENVVKNAEKISSSFPENSKISSSQFSVEDFINSQARNGINIASKEYGKAKQILKIIFPEGEVFGAKELSNKYKFLEDYIQKSPQEISSILNEFKNSMGSRLPTILADNMAYSRVIPDLKTQLQKEIKKVISSMNLPTVGRGSKSFFNKRAQENIERFFSELTPNEFINKFNDGTFKKEILEKIMSPKDFSLNIANLTRKKPPKNAQNISSKEFEKMGLNIVEEGGIEHQQFVKLLDEKLAKPLSDAELKIIGADVDASRKLGKKVRNTYGIAKPIAEPMAPQPPQLPSLTPIRAPETPPFPQNQPLARAPTMQPLETFTPQIEPTLPPAQGTAERAGDFLEKNLMGGKGLVDNPFTKLAGLKYLLGGAALPLEAAYLGAKTLTSPTAAGEIARMTFKKGGIRAIETWAQKYPSYHEGILENPQERRALTKQVEDDYTIPLEQKAIIQSKINRGKPLSDKL